MLVERAAYVNAIVVVGVAGHGYACHAGIVEDCRNRTGSPTHVFTDVVGIEALLRQGPNRQPVVGDDGPHLQHTRFGQRGHLLRASVSVL
jgi:hypothetical protein